MNTQNIHLSKFADRQHATVILHAVIWLWAMVIGYGSGATNINLAMLNLDATFTKITNGALVTEKAHWHAAAWADFDNDGLVDLVLNQFQPKSRNILYHNNGDGTFTGILQSNLQDIASPSGIYAAAWSDYDNDGHMDLFLANVGAKNVLLHNRGDATFERITQDPGDEGTISTSAVWGDFDRDGFLDLFVVNSNTGLTSASHWLYRNQGDGTFRKTTANEVGSLVSDRSSTFFGSWLDFNNDAWLDLFLPKSSHLRSWFYQNLGGTSFAFTTNNTSMSSDTFAWGDYDNDSNLDLFSPGAPHLLYHNEGAGTFKKMTATQAGSLVNDKLQGFCGGAAWGDFDNDGFLDLFVAGGRTWGMSQLKRQKSFLYRNNGDGTFSSITNVSPVNDLGESMGVYWVDYDRDGFLDLFVQDEGALSYAPNRLYHNNGNSNHWLEVTCTGTSSPRSGTGAKVRAKATIGGHEMWQVRLIDCGGTSWGGQSFEAHFGLGDAAVVDTLRIEWPSGIVQELRNVPARQCLTVTEPARLKMTKAGALNVRCWKGQCFSIETSGNLHRWEPLATITNVTGTLELADDEWSHSGARFYRAIKQ